MSDKKIYFGDLGEHNEPPYYDYGGFGDYEDFNRHDSGTGRYDNVGGNFGGPGGGNFGGPGGGNFGGPGGGGNFDNGSDRSDGSRKNGGSRIVTLTRKKLFIIILVCVLCSALLSLGSLTAYNYFFGGTGGGNTNATGSGYTLEKATGSKMTVQEIANKTSSSVVAIKTESTQTGGWIQEYVTEGAGSGIIIKSNGYIMTNNHVIEGASKIQVTVGGNDANTSNDKTYTASVVGTDTENDIAVLKINAHNLNAVTYGNSSDISVGDMAVIIGNPLGELTNSVSSGIISSTSRNLTVNNENLNVIQTDASVNPGNSGGAMFNSYGQLVGIVVAKSSGEDVEGLGFAIPVNTAAKAADNIMKGKSSASSSSSSASTGMNYIDLTDESDAQEYGVWTTGIYIKNVTGDTAQQAGFESGDMVYAIDGTKISSISQLKSVIRKHNSGDTVTYTIVRDNQEMQIDLKL